MIYFKTTRTTQTIQTMKTYDVIQLSNNAYDIYIVKSYDEVILCSEGSTDLGFCQ